MTTSGEHPTDPSAIGETAATDIGGQRLAKVYAQAILDAADAAGCRNEVLAELHSLATDVQSKVPAARALFASPRVSIEEKELLVEKICSGRVTPTTLHSLHVLARHDRLGMLSEIAAAAARLASEGDGLRRAEFTTAVPPVSTVTPIVPMVWAVAAPEPVVLIVSASKPVEVRF